MRAHRQLVLALAAAACGPSTGDDTGADDTATSAAASSTGGADTSTDGSTGEPLCTPATGGALELALELRPADAALPSAGGPSSVADDRAGGAVVVSDDETQTDSDVLIARIDADGASQWSVRYQGAAGLDDGARQVAVADDGDIYVLVREQLSELVSEGFGTRREHTIVVLALTPDGTPRWRYARELGEDERARGRIAAMTLTPEREVVVVDGNTETDGRIALTVLDRHGNVGVATELSSSLEALGDIHVALASGGDLLLSASPYPAVWTARVTRDATMVWEELTPPLGQRATAIAAGLDDDAYVLVTTGDPESGDAGFELRHFAKDGTTTTPYSHAWPDGDGYPAAIALDCAGTPIIAGEIQHGDGTGIEGRDAWLAAIASDGTELWSQTLTSTQPIAPRSLAITDTGTFWLGGYTGIELGPWVASVRAP